MVSVEVEVIFVVGSINHPGQPRTKDPSRNTKERKPHLTMNKHGHITVFYHVYHAPSTMI